MNVREDLEAKLSRFEELESLMGDPDVMSDSSKMASYAREHGSLARLANKFRSYKKMSDDIRGLIEMSESSDPEEREMAEEELLTLRAEREKLWDELLELTIGGEDANRTRCVMEIRAGTGGEEAALFARDLYDMYKRNAETRGWKTEIMDMSASERGGFKEIVVGIEGDGVFRELQFESGGHRVQRVPETETQGRVHTSAATVAVMAEPEDVEVELKKEDYRVDKFGASGPGGQHVNKTESAVRMTHIPTGVVVRCQNERSQHKNRATALKLLKAKLASLREAERDKEMAKLYGDKGEIAWGNQIRSYVMHPYQMVKDHRTNHEKGNIQAVLDGDLDEFMAAYLRQRGGAG